MEKQKLVRITTVPGSLWKLLEGQLTFMSDHYEVIIISSNEERLKNIAKENNVRYYFVGLTRKITLIKDLKALLKLYKILKKEKPFIVHTHTPKAGTIGMIAAKMAGVKHRLHTVAGMPLLEVKGVKRKILNTVEMLTYRNATKLYPNSYGLKDIIVDQKLAKKEKLKVLGNGSSNGINIEHFNPDIYTIEDNLKLRRELGIPESDTVMIFVGRLVGDKGINELVAAFTNVQKERDDISLVLVGRMEKELDPLKSDTIQEIATNKKIYTTGYQLDVRPYFSFSDFLVFPSYREGFPNVVLQASAMGLPSIVSNINGCNEIIENDYNGLIIPVKNVDVLARSMKTLLNKDLQETMSKVCRERIKTMYSHNTIWNAILKEYKEL